MPEVMLAGRRLCYRLDGPETADVVVLGNSIASDLTIWDGVVAELAPDFRVLRYDMPGHGGSDAAPEINSLRALAQAPLALMDELGIGRAHLGGISLGAMVAAELALLAPGRCRSLIYCNAVTQATPQYARMWQDRIAQTQDSMAPVIEPTLDRWLTADAPADLRRRIGAMIGRTTLPGFHAAATALTGLDLTGRMAGLTCPRLFIAGAGDQAAPAAVMQAQAAAVGASFAMIAEAAHLSSLERPAELAGQLRGWMRQAG